MSSPSLQTDRVAAVQSAYALAATLPNRDSVAAMKLRWMLYLLVSLLVFEGLMRKAFPQGVGLAIFFGKDILTFATLFMLRSAPSNECSRVLTRYVLTLAFALIPLILITTAYDPALGVFGAKQYLLFSVVGLAATRAFPPDQPAVLYRFLGYMVLLIIPTTAVAVIQQRLPASHWLNLSVGGTQLGGFSAGGFLRVSSTFPFVAQYNMFLTAAAAALGLRFFFDRDCLPKSKQFWPHVLTLVTIAPMLIGIFITGSRSSVLGALGVAVLAVALGLWRAPSVMFSKALIGCILVIAALGVLREKRPEFFAAYDTRAAGTKKESHEEEVAERVKGSLTSWTSKVDDQDPLTALIGHGLGTMSNGSDRISDYARSIRAGGFWTETDLATTMFEGGLYLMVVWNAFRLAVMLLCLKWFLRIKNPRRTAAAAFALAFVLINGTLGTLGIQPPLAIWWWIMVGVVASLYRIDALSQRPLSSPVTPQRVIQPREIPTVHRVPWPERLS